MYYTDGRFLRTCLEVEGDDAVNINCEEQRTGSARGRRQERRQAVAGEQRIGRRFDGPDALIDDPEDHASLRYGLCHRGSRSHARLGDRCLQGDRYGNGTQSTRPCSRGSLRLTSPTTSTISTVVFPAPADRRRSLMAAIVSTLFVPSLLLADKDGGGGRDFSATNAGCTEAIGFGPIPAAQAQPFVPTGFVVAPVGPGSARLVVRSANCQSMVSVRATPWFSNRQESV